jgi:protein gp37
MTGYAQHPLSAAFPQMTEPEWAEMRADIASNGQRFPITLYEDQILDGWHRYTACQGVGVKPQFAAFSGSRKQALEFVVSANLKRRHLSARQRALIAAEISTDKRGGDRKSLRNQTPIPADQRITTQAAATLFNVGQTIVREAKLVLEKGTETQKTNVKNGTISLEKAAREIRAARPKPAFKLVPPPQECGPVTVEQWKALATEHQAATLDNRARSARMNHEKAGEDANLIDWAMWTWNPITGCEHNCPYCYARDIANRFHKEGHPAFPNGFEATFRPDRLSAPLNHLPPQSDDPREARVFTGSMADVFGRWVPAEWIEAILDIQAEASQWTYLMLTKFPKRMGEFRYSSNVWLGTSVDCQLRVANAEAAFARIDASVKWLSIEPMLEPLKFKRLDLFDLIAIGGATASSATPRWIPPYGWIADLMEQADKAGCAVYLKSNLYRKELPGGPYYRFSNKLPKSLYYLRNAPE